MSFGGHNPNVSLLPDNPSAQIVPVQGGGGASGAKQAWHSYPITIPVSRSSPPLATSHTSMKRYHDLWKRTLGPSVPSRRKPRADPYVVVGVVNVLQCPTYIVAPLRGDKNAAVDCISWATDILKNDKMAHIIFMGPLKHGGSKADGEFIEKQVDLLAANFPGHALCITGEETSLRCLDGLLLHAIPETSKQIGLGFLPDPDLVYHRSSRRIDCLDVDTLRIPASSNSRADNSESIYTMEFRKPSTAYSSEKDAKSQRLVHDHVWSAPPGWVTQITFGSETMRGGAGTDKNGEGGEAEADAKVRGERTLAARKAAAAKAAAAAATTAATVPAPVVKPGEKRAEDVKAAREEEPLHMRASLPVPQTGPPPPLPPLPPPPPVPQTGPPPNVQPVKQPSMITSPQPTAGEELIILGSSTYKIRKPVESVMAEWEQGKFNEEERRLLADERLKYTDKIYAMFLKGLVSHQCDMEMEMQLDPACGIFRYIMADRYYEQVKAKNTGKQVMERQGDAQPVAMPVPPVATPVPVAMAAPKPGPVPVAVPLTGPVPAPTPTPPEDPTSPKPNNKNKTKKSAPTNTKKGGKGTRKLLRKTTH